MSTGTNVFVNASYDPRRNGTCGARIGEYYIGYQWENGQRGFALAYPFWKYKSRAVEQTFDEYVTFTLNTTFNYIV